MILETILLGVMLFATGAFYYTVLKFRSYRSEAHQNLREMQEDWQADFAILRAAFVWLEGLPNNKTRARGLSAWGNQVADILSTEEFEEEGDAE